MKNQWPESRKKALECGGLARGEAGGQGGEIDGVKKNKMCIDMSELNQLLYMLASKTNK